MNRRRVKTPGDRPSQRRALAATPGSVYRLVVQFGHCRLSLPHAADVNVLLGNAVNRRLLVDGPMLWSVVFVHLAETAGFICLFSMETT